MPSLLDVRELVVKHRPQLLEAVARYDLFDPEGGDLGSVVQVGRDNWDKTVHPSADAETVALAKRIGSDPRTAWSLKPLEVRSSNDTALFQLIRIKALKSSVVVCRPDGTEVGRICLQNAVGRSRLSLDVEGKTLAVMTATFRRRSFLVVDQAGGEIAEVEMTSGSAADHVQGKEYTVSIHRDLADPLQSLTAVAVIAADQILYD